METAKTEKLMGTRMHFNDETTTTETSKASAPKPGHGPEKKPAPIKVPPPEVPPVPVEVPPQPEEPQPIQTPGQGDLHDQLEEVKREKNQPL